MPHLLLSAISFPKGFVGKRNTTFKLKDVKALVHTAVENITPEHWKSYVKHVRGIIDEAWEKEGLKDEEIEQFVISLSGDSSDESSWEEDSDMDEDYDDSLNKAVVTWLERLGLLTRKTKDDLGKLTKKCNNTVLVTQSDRMHMSWSELLMAFDAGAVSAWTRMEGTSKTFYEETPENT
ncbi:hypothetical protein GE061_017201 [Apolygus lucorum]|uniref:Uncharacterized protein n=1 Tax=Apolygus lucorum TaxID=248454 RepID=A0A8S9XAF9_APOLU|nr:hypothetical protein GE061_017201 [Apolygus lucorum]